MFAQKLIKIFHSVQEIGLFSLFQNLALGKASTNNRYHFAISWTRFRQYQCVCKILSKYSKRFKSSWHFSRTGRRQNLHKLSGDKIKCLIIGHTMKVNLQFQLTFLGSCNPTHSNYQDPQHMASADIRFEMRQRALTHPKPSHLNWHDPQNPTAECTRHKMSTLATPQLSRKITQTWKHYYFLDQASFGLSSSYWVVRVYHSLHHLPGVPAIAHVNVTFFVDWRTIPPPNLNSVSLGYSTNFSLMEWSRESM